MVSWLLPSLVAGLAVSGYAFREDGPRGLKREHVPRGVSFPYSGVSEVKVPVAQRLNQRNEHLGVGDIRMARMRPCRESRMVRRGRGSREGNGQGPREKILDKGEDTRGCDLRKHRWCC